MIYSVEYGLHDIHCGGHTFISASNMEQAQSRAIRLAHKLFFRKVDDNQIRFPNQKQLYEKVVNDLHLPNTWDKWDTTWEYVSDLYWSMVDDHVWYKVEEESDMDSSLFGTTTMWEGEQLYGNMLVNTPRVAYEEWEEF